MVITQVGLKPMISGLRGRHLNHLATAPLINILIWFDMFTVAPPPPAPQLPGTSSPDKSQMNVKRINWEKLDQQRVENTVWEQVLLTFYPISIL
jgi:hypothetical protein